MPRPPRRQIPSWFLVARQDKTINPRQERFEARRAHAHTVEINSSHVAMIAHPQAVTDLIVKAATATGSARPSPAANPSGSPRPGGVPARRHGRRVGDRGRGGASPERWGAPRRPTPAPALTARRRLPPTTDDRHDHRRPARPLATGATTGDRHDRYDRHDR
nr:hypothetical protein [Streptomyces sabulosicollis]